MFAAAAFGGPLDAADFSRVVVIGTSGAGKTTFAARVAALLDAPHVELDALHWGPGWTPRADFAESVERAIAPSRWVVAGNYSAVRERIWSRATAIVLLDYPFPLVFWRALRRTLARIWSGEPTHGGNRETFVHSFLHKDGIPWWVLRSFRRHRRNHRKMLCDPAYAHASVFALETPAQAEALLARVIA